MTSMTGSTGMGSSFGNTKSFSKPPKGYGALQNFSPEQMQLFQQLFSNVGPESFLSRLSSGDQGTFDQMEAPALRQFQELQGENASRFSGMGMGARKGSGFSNFQSQATSDFAQDLQSKRQLLQRQAMSDLMGMSNSLLGQKPYGFYQKPQKQGSGWGSIGGAALGGLGGLLAGGGNPMMGLQGANLGYGIGSGFDQGRY